MGLGLILSMIKCSKIMFQQCGMPSRTSLSRLYILMLLQIIVTVVNLLMESRNTIIDIAYEAFDYLKNTFSHAKVQEFLKFFSTTIHNDFVNLEVCSIGTKKSIRLDRLNCQVLLTETFKV